MTEIDDIFSLIGLPISDERVTALLQRFAIDPNVTFKRGEDTAFVKSHPHGVEVTFCDEAAVQSRRGSYLEGEPVLVNFRMYVRPTGEFQPFQSALPLGLHSGMKRSDVERVLGTPTFSNDTLGTARWDRSGSSIAVSVARTDGSLKDVSVLLWP